MGKGGFVLRHGIVRNAIRRDLLCFLLPAFFVYCAGMGVSGWDVIRRGGSLDILSVQGVAGLVFVVVGLTICLVAAGTLRRFYCSTLVIREDHQLITHGVYRLVRHPIYLGAGMVCVGVPVCVSSVYGLLIMSGLMPLILNRIRMEERLLIDEFGDAYRRYKEHTSKLIPLVY